jgi:hypothetical protein
MVNLYDNMGISENDIKVRAFGHGDGDRERDVMEVFGKLPLCILEKIYKEYLEPDILWKKYNDILDLHSSKSLCIKALRSCVTDFLAKPLVCKYFSKKCSGWRYSYKVHKEDKNRRFVLGNNGDSFCLSILMMLYH